jgi:hypothetical protein
MRFVFYNLATGDILPGIHETSDATTIEASVPPGCAVWPEAISARDFRIVDGTVVAKPPDLELLRSEALAMVERLARKREAALTPGRAAVYAEKERQARAILAGRPDRVDLVAADGGDQVEAARHIVAAAEAARAAAYDLEVRRRRAKVALLAATTPAEIESVTL